MIRIATRGSALARWQADHVAERLRAAHPGRETEVRVFTTRGDVETGPLAQLGGTGLFTAEVDRALLEGDADLAVHSLKDLPIDPPEGLVVASVPERAPWEDVLVSTDGAPLAELPAGGAVGTSSPRRAAYVRSVRPDLRIVELRGNVPTRIEKVTSGAIAGTVMARAGLMRLGLEDRASEVLLDLLPAPGQGALALVARAGTEAAELAAALEHAETRTAVDTERGVLAGLGGGCSLPLGVHAARNGGGWRVRSVLFGDDGAEPRRDDRTGRDPARLARESADALAKGVAT